MVASIMTMMVMEGRFGKERKDRTRQKGGTGVSQDMEIPCGRWRENSIWNREQEARAKGSG